LIKVYAYPTTSPHAKDIVLVDRREFEFVSGPEIADWLYSPVDLGKVFWDAGADGVRRFVQSLPYYAGNERRHFFHDYSAESGDWRLNSVLFRAVKSRHDPNPLTVSVPHWVDDFAPQQVDFSTLPYDVCFVGRTGACPVRQKACQAVANDRSIRSLIKSYDEFFGYIPEGTPKFVQRRAEFINAFRVGKLALSPRGVELDAYRTWEGMSAQRPVIWIGDDYELPFWDFVDYGKFMFIVPESKASQANEVVKSILATHTDVQLQEHGVWARRYWLEYFRREAIPKTFAHYLRLMRC
jgi:hypothetical protein